MDAQNAHSLNQYWGIQDSLYDVAMSDSVNIDMYKENGRPSLRGYSNTWEGNTIQTSGFELLKQNANLAKESLNPLISKISEIYDYYTLEFELNFNNMSEFQNHRKRQMSEKYDWWHKDNKSDEWLHFYLNNPEYKNYIKQHAEIITSSRADSERFMIKAVDILQQIEETRIGKKIRIESVFSKIIGPITSFKIEPCIKNIPNSKLKSDAKYIYNIFTNETSGPVEIWVVTPTGDDFILKNRNGFSPYSETAPISITSGKSSILRLRNGLTLKIIDVNGNCIGYHITTKENSVILIK